MWGRFLSPKTCSSTVLLEGKVVSTLIISKSLENWIYGIRLLKIRFCDRRCKTGIWCSIIQFSIFNFFENLLAGKYTDRFLQWCCSKTFTMKRSLCGWRNPVKSWLFVYWINHAHWGEWILCPIIILLRRQAQLDRKRTFCSLFCFHFNFWKLKIEFWLSFFLFLFFKIENWNGSSDPIFNFSKACLCHSLINWEVCNKDVTKHFSIFYFPLTGLKKIFRMIDCTIWFSISFSQFTFITGGTRYIFQYTLYKLWNNSYVNRSQ